jgi:hypothetical protein
MKTILLVSPFFVVPNNHGGKTDVFNRVVALHKLGYSIDFLYTEEDEVTAYDLIHELKKYVRNIYFAKRRGGVKSLVSIKPYQVQTRKSLKHIRLNNTYDYTILEGDYVGAIMDNRTIKLGKVILRVHNNEKIYFFNLFKSTLPSLSSIYYLSDSIKFSIYSKNLFAKVNNFLFISQKEEANHKSSSGKFSLTLLPDFPADSFLSGHDSEDNNVLFLGSLSAPNNIEGLCWYLENAHEKLINDKINYTFTIVGSVKESELNKKLSSAIKNTTSISLFVNVPDVKSYYEKASVFVNPMLHGAGVKVKSIEAIVNGLPLVTTETGAEGIGLKNNLDAIITNDEIKFYEGVKALLLDAGLREKLVVNSQHFIINKSHANLLPPFLEQVT